MKRVWGGRKFISTYGKLKLLLATLTILIKQSGKPQKSLLSSKSNHTEFERSKSIIGKLGLKSQGS